MTDAPAADAERRFKVRDERVGLERRFKHRQDRVADGMTASGSPAGGMTKAARTRLG